MHDAVVVPDPPTEPPDGQGPRTRVTTVDELVRNADGEGLAAKGARVLARDIVRCILVNRLLPELGLWPTFDTLKMYVSG